MSQIGVIAMKCRIFVQAFHKSFINFYIILCNANWIFIILYFYFSESKDLISNGHKKIDIEEQAPMIVDG